METSSHILDKMSQQGSRHRYSRKSFQQNYRKNSKTTYFVKLTHVHGFFTGAKVPYCHRKGPFSCSKPSRELHPGPPLSQMVISSLASGFEEGKNQKYSCRVSFDAEEMGRRPA